MYTPSLLKQYLKAKYDNRIAVKNQELYSLCGCENDNQKGSIRALKSQFFELFKNESNNESNDEIIETKLDNSIVLSKSETKSISSEVSSQHILKTIRQYPELPLFIYSKIFESVKDEYDQLYHQSSKVDWDSMTFSFYDLYIEIFKAINNGKYDQDIKEYMNDVITNFGNTHTYELERAEFKLSSSKEDDYLSTEDYNYFLEDILSIIAEIINYFTGELTFNELRVEMLRYLLIKSTGHDNTLVSNIVSMRPKELIRADILKLYILGRKTYSKMESIEELYDEFDKRYSDKLDLREYGINYRGQWDHEFYKDKKGELFYKSVLITALLWEREGFEGLEKSDISNIEHLTEESKKYWSIVFKRYLKNKPDNYRDLIYITEEPELTLVEPEVITPKQKVIDKTERFENELNRLKNGSSDI